MTWKYLPVLNKLLQILVTITIGVGAGILDVIVAEKFMPHAVTFVFYIAFPSLVVR